MTYDLDKKILKIVDINEPQRNLELKTEHHNIEDLHFCVVIISGELIFYR